MKKFTLFWGFIVLCLSANHNLNFLAEDAQKLPVLAQTILFQKLPQAKIIDLKELNQEMRDYLDEQKKPYDTVLMRDFNGDKLIDAALLIKCIDKNGIDRKACYFIK